MTSDPTVAFYAPLKSPESPVPSGDREIARLMIQALRLAGCAVDQVSAVISYQKRPSAELYDRRRAQVAAEEARIRTLWNRDATRIPDLWFTYHPYCKSPDWLGPPLCRSFGIPYVTAEACRTRQGTDRDWAKGRAATQGAVRFARRNFVLKESDWQYLSTLMPGMETAVRIKPFVNVADMPMVSEACRLFDNDHPVLLAAGMMRPGAKSDSYRLLAAALKRIEDRKWNLVVAGDGPERAAVEALLTFSDTDRVRFAGSVEHRVMFGLMDASDLFVWPGVGEAIGLVYLEAQARGLPVVALNTAGVPLVVGDRVGGLLVASDNADDFAATIGRLLNAPDERHQLGRNASKYVAEHHDVSTVARIFRTEICRVLSG
jgi:glycosyltransferase involved in cell wall biosynthesis